MTSMPITSAAAPITTSRTRGCPARPGMAAMARVEIRDCIHQEEPQTGDQQGTHAAQDAPAIRPPLPAGGRRRSQAIATQPIRMHAIEASFPLPPYDG